MGQARDGYPVHPLSSWMRGAPMWFWLAVLASVALLSLWFSRLRRGDADDPRLAARASAEAEKQKYNWY
jgi:hypothetical protein